MSRPKLYSGTRNASSWAMRAWLALRAAGVDFEEEIVNIVRPQRFANLKAVGRISPPAMVPVLVVDGVAIYDSLAIMEYANDACGGRLLPVDVTQRAQARSLAAWQHSGLSNICARISFESAFYPEKRTLTAVETSECERLFGVLAKYVAESSGPFLFGTLSLADLILVPTIVRLVAHDPVVPSRDAIEAWTQTLLAMADVKEWMRDARLLPPIWSDDYLVPGQPVDLRVIPDPFDAA
ncbi:glutathione S-transferase family protein [Pinirhizobacter soli]|uniref:glutathione S-transferase family protein n=1 Tax=Pinirhizobacter soli TaxID=2786953 RepID=UPI0031BA5480